MMTAAYPRRLASGRPGGAQSGLHPNVWGPDSQNGEMILLRMSPLDLISSSTWLGRDGRSWHCRPRPAPRNIVTGSCALWFAELVFDASGFTTRPLTCSTSELISAEKAWPDGEYRSIQDRTVTGQSVRILETASSNTHFESNSNDLWHVALAGCTRTWESQVDRRTWGGRQITKGSR